MGLKVRREGDAGGDDEGETAGASCHVDAMVVLWETVRLGQGESQSCHSFSFLRKLVHWKFLSFVSVGVQSIQTRSRRNFQRLL